VDEINFGGALRHLRDMMRIFIEDLRVPLGLQTVPMSAVSAALSHQTREIWHFEDVTERVLETIGPSSSCGSSPCLKTGPLAFMSLDVALVGHIRVQHLLDKRIALFFKLSQRVYA
jgi:hypothetical protein